MRPLGEIGLIALLCWNGIVFLLYALDKHRAKRGRWRISEKALLSCAFLGGGVGAAAGMYGLRHKTRHTSFRVLVPIACLLTVVLFALLVWVLYRPPTV